ENVEEAAALLPAHGVPFNRDGWQHILDVHGGYLPLEIEAVPEGTVLPVSNVLVQVRNTDPECYWLTSYAETSLLRAVWYPTTVATRSFACRRTIAAALEKTADSSEGLEFKLHDFGARGASSLETAAIGAAAHLLNFRGTDTLSGILALREFYGAEMPAFSIPAAEHSTITCWGRDREAEAYGNMIAQFGGQGRVVAVVSDSYDLFRAIDELWGRQLRDRVVASGGTLVIRPDSGDPVTIVCESLERLMARFGHRVNSKGYRVLPNYVRLIQGDGVSPAAIARILDALAARGLSAENIAFGMGGELLQNVNRDTLKFAMKASAIEIGGHWSDVYKDPVTDTGKRSKRGRLALVRDPWRTVRAESAGSGDNALRVVYRDGRLLVDESFETIRARVHPA
ncbi:MAG TPA: nicotinate phosphoribosyltransferase, partial [Rhodanobacteraceae bacterium]|nr:nicotinate phosphoribosyltransferase [Rhodanobacteraceae bacterium]